MATVKQLTQPDAPDVPDAADGGASGGRRDAGTATSSGAGVPVTGEVLEWAREESGWELAEVAEKLGVDESVILDWEAERSQSQPDKEQTATLAKLYDRQQDVFLLPEAPPKLLSPEFRKAPGLGNHKLTPAELVKIRVAWRLQDMVSLLLEDESDRKRFDHFLVSDDPEKAAERFRGVLGVSVEEQFGSKDAYGAFELWRAHLEKISFLVLRLGMGHDSIRGFSFQDDFAPLVVVNNSYNVQARIFTLFHEVGHIVTKTEAPCLEYYPGGAEQVGGAERDDNTKRDVESWCDQFSAALLMPAREFASLAEKHGIAPASPDIDIKVVAKLARKFKVSIRAASIRLQTLGLAEPGFYYRVEGTLKSGDFPDQKGRPQGKPAAKKRLDEYGQRPIKILIEAYERKDIGILDLSDFLDLTVEQIDELKRSLNG